MHLKTRVRFRERLIFETDVLSNFHCNGNIISVAFEKRFIETRVRDRSSYSRTFIFSRLDEHRPKNRIESFECCKFEENIGILFENGGQSGIDDVVSCTESRWKL